MTDRPLEQADLAPLLTLTTHVSRDASTALRPSHWDALPKSQKKKLGLATTMKQFADLHSVHPNRLYEDRKSDEYAKFKVEADDSNARQLDPRGTAAISESKREALANDDLAVYEQLKVSF